MINLFGTLFIKEKRINNTEADSFAVKTPFSCTLSVNLRYRSSVLLALLKANAILQKLLLNYATQIQAYDV